MSVVTWEVVSFAVQTTTSDRVTDRLFANGNMQVPVIVTIRAINSATGATHLLSAAQLQEIELIDYFSGAVLTAPWSSSRTPNDFAHTVAGTNDPVVEQPTSDIPQSVQLYVTSTRIENRVIGARLTRADSPTVWSTNSPLFNSSVTLTAIQPVIYTTSNITVGDKQTVATGNWTWSYAINVFVTEHRRDWRQENYFVTSNVHPILKADLHNFNTDTTLTNAFSMGWNRFDLNLFYFWNPGHQFSKQVGQFNRHQSLIPDAETPNLMLHVWTRDATATVQVNQQRNALCLTHMIFHNDDNWGPGFSSWNYNAWVRLYDTFGNYGDFDVKVRTSTGEDGTTELTPYLQNRNIANLNDPDSKL
ncbi:uncharacterized protein N7483_003595 [Penicillium malachiteum]|uniref:uncharacterized protein n=1 Tax=Penicillium malachiteum TaxID=1324776 RepID=UPI00254667CD|nr:uncharacterized protein N7483_003595 [Penicillium malachiteum]KAJ5729087.1 hypothetical protein N7483_003595 [Penicillium malachiteum]